MRPPGGEQTKEGTRSCNSVCPLSTTHRISPPRVRALRPPGGRRSLRRPRVSTGCSNEGARSQATFVESLLGSAVRQKVLEAVQRLIIIFATQPLGLRLSEGIGVGFAATCRGLLLGRWLPKLNLVAFRVYDPPELSEL